MILPCYDCHPFMENETRYVLIPAERRVMCASICITWLEWKLYNPSSHWNYEKQRKQNNNNSNNKQRNLIFVSTLFKYKVFNIIAIAVSLPKRLTRIKVRDHQLVCRLQKFSFWLLQGRKENWQLWKVSWPRQKYFKHGSAEIFIAYHLIF